MKRVLVMVILLISLLPVQAENTEDSSWSILEFTHIGDGVNATWRAHVSGFETSNSTQELLDTLEARDSLGIGCCLLQNSIFEVNSFEIANLSISDGIASWDETYNLTTTTSDNVFRLDIPAVESSALRIITPSGWQVSSSVAPSWMSGLPHDLTIDRIRSSLPAMITLVLSKNEPPEFSVNLPPNLPWDIPVDLQVEVEDTHLSIVQCDWDLPSNPILLSSTEQNPATNITITTTCSDEGGLQHSITTTHNIDLSAPSVEGISGVNITCIEECHSIEVPSETPLSLTLNISDDLTESPKVKWTSNKSVDWSASGSQINLSFWPTEGINTASTPISERVKRQPLHYWLLAEISDDSGRVTTLNLSVIVNDASPPNILSELLYGNLTRPVAGVEFDIDLSQSWDMWDTYQDLQFEFYLDGEKVERPFSSDAGEHTLRIVAQDSSGNMRSKEIDIQVDPATGLDLRLIDAASDKGETRIELENHGSSEGWFRVCHEQNCVMGFSKGATWEGPVKTAVVLESEAGWFESMILEIEWEDEQGVVHKESINSGITGEPPIPLSICLPLLMALAAIILLFVKSSNTEEES